MKALSGGPRVLGFRLEVDTENGWRRLAQDMSKLYLQGLATGWCTALHPRAAIRLLRCNDDTLVQFWAACDEPELGRIAGWPTAEQCLRAAVQALRQVPTRVSGATEAECVQADAALAALGQPPAPKHGAIRGT